MKKLLLLFLSGFLSLTTLFSQNFKARYAWVKCLKGLDMLDHQEPKSIALDKKGNIYTTGYFTHYLDCDPGKDTFKLDSKFSSQDVFISKLDANGRFRWAKSLGSTLADVGYSIITDSFYNVFVSGYFSGTVDFDPGADTSLLIAKGKKDAFLLKLDSAGKFLWAKQFGGTGDDIGVSIAVDPPGNVYLTGEFYDTVDFEPGLGVYKMVSAGYDDIFILKLSPNGVFKWVKKAGGAGFDIPTAIALDPSGKIYVSGTFSGTTDFDPGSNTYNLASVGSYDCFVFRLDSSGNFSWAKKFGNGNGESLFGMCIDKSRNIYLTGRFQDGVDFDPGSGTYALSSNSGSYDGFVSKLNQDGNFVWARIIGSNLGDWGQAVETDYFGSLYFTGHFNGKVDLDPGPDSLFFNSASNNARDIFVTKWDSSANFRWAKSFGGVYEEIVAGIVLDKQLGVYTTGYFRDSVDFNTESGRNFVKASGVPDIYVHKLEQCITGAATIKVTVCNSYTSPSGRFMWVNSGTFADTITNYKGCDSLLKIQLTVNKRSSAIWLKKVCGSYMSPSGKYTWNVSGAYRDTIPNFYGCDSTLLINLTVSQASSASHFRDLCKPMVSPSGKYSWTTSGNYTDTIKNKKGCDSIMSFKLNFIKSGSAVVSLASCNSFRSPSAKYTWTSSGTYYDTIVNYLGCDSALTIHLKIYKPSSALVSLSGCNTCQSPSGKYTWTYSGNYFDTISNYHGCDSLLNISLKILRNSNSSRVISACDRYVSPSGKYVWTISGTYEDTIPNYSGCDSLISVDLTIRKSAQTNLSPQLCFGESIKVGKHLYASAGNYNDTLKSFNGCDSIVFTQLSYMPAIDVSTTLNNTTITANLSGAAYQWLDCNKNYAPVTGAKNQSYTAILNGDYAVQILKDNCDDTSACVYIHTIGIRDVTNENTWLSIYPNPYSGTFNLNLRDHAGILICNVLGDIVYSDQLMAGNHTLKLENLPVGIYFVFASSAYDQKTIKLVKY